MIFNIRWYITVIIINVLYIFEGMTLMKKLVIEKAELIENINKLKSVTNSPIIATLKNNGYGLGLD